MLPERATRRIPNKLPSVQALLQRLLSILLCLAIWTTTLRLYHRLSIVNPAWMIPSWSAFFAIVGAVSFVVGCVSVFVMGEHVSADQRRSGGAGEMYGARKSKTGSEGLE